VSDGARRIKDEHAVIQFVANLGGFRERFDERCQIFRWSLIANSDLGQSLDQIKSRGSCSVSRTEASSVHNRIISTQMKRLSLFDQLQIRCPISARTRREPQRRACQSPAWRQLEDIPGKSVRTCRPVNLIVRLRRHGSISKDIGSRVGRALFCNYYRKNGAFWLVSCWSSLVFRRLLVTPALLGIPFEQE
jgi:hypothetical protein